MTHPTIRASDDDRDAVTERLREAFAEGRLTDAELSDRLGLALAARTVGELTPLTADLPVNLPRREHRSTRPAGQARVDRLTPAWAAWAAAVTINLLIWALVALGTGELVYFWPMWVAGPWGAVLLARAVGSSPTRPRCAAHPG